MWSEALQKRARRPARSLFLGRTRSPNIYRQNGSFLTKLDACSSTNGTKTCPPISTDWMRESAAPISRVQDPVTESVVRSSEGSSFRRASREFLETARRRNARRCAESGTVEVGPRRPCRRFKLRFPTVERQHASGRTPQLGRNVASCRGAWESRVVDALMTGAAVRLPALAAPLPLIGDTDQLPSPGQVLANLATLVAITPMDSVPHASLCSHHRYLLHSVASPIRPSPVGLTAMLAVARL